MSTEAVDDFLIRAFLGAGPVAFEVVVMRASALRLVALVVTTGLMDLLASLVSSPGSCELLLLETDLMTLPVTGRGTFGLADLKTRAFMLEGIFCSSSLL